MKTRCEFVAKTFPIVSDLENYLFALRLVPKRELLGA